MPTFADRKVLRSQRGGFPTAVISDLYTEFYAKKLRKFIDIRFTAVQLVINNFNDEDVIIPCYVICKQENPLTLLIY
jgi:hypothetical protein